MREQLIFAMASRLGQSITSETALSILADLFPDKSWAPWSFGVREYEGYTFQCERLADVRAELHPLHAQHYAETEDYLMGIPMDVDYDGMLERERAGGMIQFTARVKDSGELIGNMRVYINRSIHNKKLFCTEDTFFVVPEHRGGFMAVRLWQFVENSVRVIVGVRGVAFDSKLSNKADQMAKYLKYTPVSTRHVKMFN